VGILTENRHDLAVVDRGHRALKTRLLIGGIRRGLTPKLSADLRRRSAIDAEIRYVKTDGRISTYPLKGTRGDAIFSVLWGCGHNM
jgi:IS5 family transposase